MYQATEQFTDWLQWFTDEDGITQPFSLPNGPSDEIRRAATDGRTAVVTTDIGPVFEMAPRRWAVKSAIVSMIEAAPIAGPVEIEGARLRGVIGPCEHPAMITCPKCKGTKSVEHNCDCPHCTCTHDPCNDCSEDGEKEPSGQVASIPKNRHIEIWDLCLDQNRIAYLLEHAPPSGIYTLSVVPMVKDDNCLRIEGYRFTALVATLVAKNVLREESFKRVLADLCPASETIAVG